MRTLPDVLFTSKARQSFYVQLVIHSNTQCSFSLAPSEMVTSSCTALPEQSAWLTWPEGTLTGSTREAPCFLWAPSFSARAASSQLCTGLSRTQRRNAHCVALCWYLLLKLCGVCGCVCVFSQGGDWKETRKVQSGVPHRYQEPLLPQHTTFLCSIWQQTNGTHSCTRYTALLTVFFCTSNLMMVLVQIFRMFIPIKK